MMKKYFTVLFLAFFFPAFYTAAQYMTATCFALAAGVMDKDTVLFVESCTPYILIIACIFTLAALFVLFALTKKPFHKRIMTTPPDIAVTVTALLSGLTLNFILTLIMSILPIPEEVWAAYESSYADPLLGGGVISVLCVILVVPVTEELIFRGLAYGGLRGKMPYWMALTVQSVIFAAFHFNPLQFFYVLISAFALGIFYDKAESIFAAIIFHAAFNSGSLALPLFFPAGIGAESFFIVFITSLLVFYMCMRKIWRGRDNGKG